MDKFGNYVHKRLRREPTYSDLSYILMKNDRGEYDLKSSRLKGLTIPLSSDEAVNKQYIDQKLDEFYNKLELDAKIKNINTQIQMLLNQLQVEHSTKDKVSH